ncbi:zf-HC2 domain-containing protein [Sphaerotilus uruguayifluvii]|uniref:Zinc-finger domain-containing protein n=1 Tax=Sphaerotilus uruguayifluvii TaxID=2735897 RepID=A0ABX2G387_9BURK|nr:zf-HC2 domain-containing protein [Leptothrix sp. C29]NRT55887.1 hypothetical protein [Leptothrix sp. C29]
MRKMLLPDCKETTRLVLEGEDRQLQPLERARVRLHWRMCTGCARFGRQVELMREAMGSWRRHAEPEESGRQD